MKQDVTVPEVGESVSSGVLATWLKQSGEQVSEGEDLFELETDKATLNVPAPASGMLETTVDEDTEVEVGQAVGSIDTAAAGTAPSAGDAGRTGESGQSGDGGRTRDSSRDGEDIRTGASTSKSESGGAGASAAERASDSERASDVAGASDATAALDELPPAARRVASEHGLDVSQIRGTGKGGRVTKEDALRAVEEQVGGRSTEARGDDGPTSAGATGGSGDRAPVTDVASPGSSSAPGTTESSDRGGRQTRKKLSNLRKRIAANLVSAKQNAAHLTTFNEVDMSSVMDIRSRYKEAFERKHEVKLGFMSFFVKACEKALEAYPEVNAYLQEEEIVYNHFYNIGVALSSDRGLITPVVRNVEEKSFAEIEREILGFIGKAKEKRLMPDELTGGTFTISNGGVFGSMLSTPIPNPPQTAILGMHTIQKRPVVVEDEIAIRPMMYLALSYDHRMIDGREAIGFLMKIKQYIEDPTQLLIDL